MTQKPPLGSVNSSVPEQFLMETLMSEALQMSGPMSFQDTPSAISLQASEDGVLPCSLPDGPKIDPSGQAHAHASPSALPERAVEQMTKGTYGPSLPNSSEPASLQSCLASRLQARLAVIGSPEYSLTWKEWPINGQEPICALRASALRTSGNDSTGWPTCAARDWKSGKSNLHGQNARPLSEVAMLAGWPTPIVNDTTGSTHCYGKTQQDGTRDIFLKLPGAAKLVGWPTPNTCNVKGAYQSQELIAARKESGRQQNLQDVVKLAGRTPNLSNAETEKLAAFRLNPLFSLWLMGFPPHEWAFCAEQAMPSSRKLRRSLSRPSLTVSPS
jgi:hypothetical protein